MDSGVPSGRYWEPQPETLEEQEKAYFEKLKVHGGIDEVLEPPCV